MLRVALHLLLAMLQESLRASLPGRSVIPPAVATAFPIDMNRTSQDWACAELRRRAGAEWIIEVRRKMELAENRERYRLRKQTVEPVFGIVKEAMGFGRFLLRGLEKVEGSGPW